MFKNLRFTALHWMQDSLVARKVSIRLSNACTWQNGRKICPGFYTIRKKI